MNNPDLKKKDFFRFAKHMKKPRRTKVEPRSLTITAERLSDHSHITFTISSDKTIEQLRALLNHHLPPLLPNKFDLYSYQRGARIHFHPPPFKLDYFPVIFDQSVLLLKMDDRIVNDVDLQSVQNYSKNRKRTNRYRCSILRNFLSNKTAMRQAKSPTKSTSSKSITCLSLLKQFFQRSSSTDVSQASSTPSVTSETNNS